MAANPIVRAWFSPAAVRAQGLGGGDGPACGAQPPSPPSPLLAGPALAPAAGSGASQLSSASAVTGGGCGAAAATSPAAAAATGSTGAAGGATSTCPSTMASSMLLAALASGRKLNVWLRPGPPCCTLPLTPPCWAAAAVLPAAPAPPCCSGCSCSERHSDLAPERSCSQRLPAAAGAPSPPLAPREPAAARGSSRLAARRRAGSTRDAMRCLPEAAKEPGRAARPLSAQSMWLGCRALTASPGAHSSSVGWCYRLVIKGT